MTNIVGFDFFLTICYLQETNFKYKNKRWREKYIPRKFWQQQKVQVVTLMSEKVDFKADT